MRNSSWRWGAASALAVALAFPFVAHAREEAGAADDARDAIVVTGTRISGRTVTTSPVPVDQLSGEDLRSSDRQPVEREFEFLIRG